MNKWYTLPLLGVLGSLGYGVYAVWRYKYLPTQVSLPVFPTWRLDLEPSDSKLLSDIPKKPNENIPKDTVIVVIEKETKPEEKPLTPPIATPAIEQPPTPTPSPEPTPTPYPQKATDDNIEINSKPANENAIDPKAVNTIENPKIPKVASSSEAEPTQIATSDAKNPTDASATAAQATNAYETDEDYLNNQTWRSMAWRFRDSLLSAPYGSPAWEEKAEKLRRRYEHQPTLWTYWFDYWNPKEITAKMVTDLCRKAMSYSEFGTIFHVGISRHYYDFMWKICGREDKPKPSRWWFSSHV